MQHCDCCGAPRISTVDRGGLVVTDQPLSASWQGTPLKMWPSDMRAFFELVRWKQISHDRILQLAPFGSEGLDLNNSYMRALRMRRELKRVGCPFRIVLRQQWGYVLEGV